MPGNFKLVSWTAWFDCSEVPELSFRATCRPDSKPRHVAAVHGGACVRVADDSGGREVGVSTSRGGKKGRFFWGLMSVGHRSGGLKSAVREGVFKERIRGKGVRGSSYFHPLWGCHGLTSPGYEATDGHVFT